MAYGVQNPAMYDSDDDNVADEVDDDVNDGVSSNSNNSNVLRRRGVSTSLSNIIVSCTKLTSSRDR